MSNYDVSLGTNQNVVLNVLRDAGLRYVVCAGIMGNIEAESKFNTAWSGDQGSVGICQWREGRKNNLVNFANAIGGSVTDINVQAAFIIEELTGARFGNTYKDFSASYFDEIAKAVNVKKAVDIVTALYERAQNYSTWSDVVDACNTSSWMTIDRYSTDANTYNGRFYIDTPKRRGYADAYFELIV